MTSPPDAAALGPFVLAVVVIALTPGPDMAFFLGRALAGGRAQGLAAAAGAMTGVLAHTAAVALGLSALIAAAPQAFLALKLAGAFYLLWLAAGALRRGSAQRLLARPQGRTGPAARGLASTWAAGLAINLLNPKIMIFFMTFLPQFVAPGDPDAARRLLTLGGLFIAISLPIVLAIVLLADRVAALLNNRPRVARAMDWLFAGVFATIAAQILLTRVR